MGLKIQTARVRKLNRNLCMAAVAVVEREVSAALSRVHERILRACAEAQRKPRLVAVSKTKSPGLILAAYNSGQRHFGENYVQELVEKANHPLLASLDICWSFIGHLQRNKCNKLASVRNLWAVESVDTERLATALDGSWKRQLQEPTPHRLKVFVQVNTSGEDSKRGCHPSGTVALVNHVIKTCSGLEFIGLMTIGRMGCLSANPDFQCLEEVRQQVCRELGLGSDKVELSMGMSADLEEAIQNGSTHLRVGTAIFGARPTELKKCTSTGAICNSAN